MFDTDIVIQATQILNVTASDGKQNWGNGVFISPNHVLTAGHVVEDARQIKVGNICDLDTSWKLVAHDTNLDASIILLPQSLSNCFCGVAEFLFDRRKWIFDVSKKLPHTKTFLSSKAREEPLVEDVDLPLMTSVPFVGNGVTVDFFAASSVFSGFSGSPILNADGEVISLVTHTYEGDINFAPDGKVGHKDMPYRFLGPSPWRFVPWMNKQKEALGL